MRLLVNIVTAIQMNAYTSDVDYELMSDGFVLSTN